MRAVDAFQAVPSLLVALFVLFVLGGGLVNMVLVFALVRWVVYTRLARGVTLACRESSYVEAARSIGATDLRIVFRHLLPNMLSPLLVLATLEGGPPHPRRGGLELPRIRAQAPRALLGPHDRARGANTCARRGG